MLRFAPLRDADGNGGGTVAPAPAVASSAPAAQTAPAPAVAPEAPKVDAAKIAKEAKAAARAEFLRDAGFDSEDAFEADRVARKKAEEAKLSEQERLTKAFEASEKANAKTAAKLAAAEAERDTARTELSLMKGGVSADQLDVASYLHAKARKDDGDTFDETKWLAKLRTEKPYLFGVGTSSSTAPPAANTTANPPAASPAYGAPVAKGMPNADDMTPQQWAAFKRDGFQVTSHLVKKTDNGEAPCPRSSRTSPPRSST